MSDDRSTIAILGGTGALGSGLAQRWALAGHAVILGSRSAEKARTAARAINDAIGVASISGLDNVAAAQAAEIVVISVPFASHDATLDEIRDAVQGKIVIDAVVPLVPPKVSIVQLPDGGSAGQIAQQRLGDGVRVVSAFHNVGAAKLASSQPIGCDVLVFGNDKGARDAVIALVEAIGTRGIDGGPIANSIAGEALTSILIGINRRYRIPDAGIRITGALGES